MFFVTGLIPSLVTQNAIFASLPRQRALPTLLNERLALFCVSLLSKRYLYVAKFASQQDHGYAKLVPETYGDSRAL